MPACKFNLERDPPVYMCGEKVVGYVEVTFVKDRLLEDIRIIFRGMATVSWVDTMTRFPKLYSGEETYMEMETIVFQGGPLLADTYRYNFYFHVPDVCPTTCTTDIGKIFCELIVLVSFENEGKSKFPTEIMVIQTVDIEKVPNAMLPVECSDEMFFCCWPCAAGPVAVYLKSARYAYIPGNTIEFSIGLTNKSKRFKFRTTLTTYLIQVYKYIAEEPRHRSRYISYILNSVKKHIIVESGDMAVLDDQFSVPPLPPSTQGNHIISIKYELRLEMRINAVSRSTTSLDLPIVIGTTVESAAAHTVLVNK
ncbi:arrestin domain-containing protein 3-like isoform X1 [Anastrepha obliqua]|uniref:arrestin domain-containing protein 3-like isoform X1 n=2 Tax=Anastrepha obliqua TaxID=95512 RepID=UPI00240944D8|nr:arrestin domain-containing protein 3-like isoform X1 [Anastrepha obliqua]